MAYFQKLTISLIYCSIFFSLYAHSSPPNTPVPSSCLEKNSSENVPGNTEDKKLFFWAPTTIHMWGFSANSCSYTSSDRSELENSLTTQCKNEAKLQGLMDQYGRMIWDGHVVCQFKPPLWVPITIHVQCPQRSDSDTQSRVFEGYFVPSAYTKIGYRCQALYNCISENKLNAAELKSAQSWFDSLSCNNREIKN